MDYPTLILTPWLVPHRVVPWFESICLQITEKIEVIETYEETVSSPSVTFRIPCVARLKRHVYAYKNGVRFSRVNVMTRDGFQCQYCGRRLPMRELNYDHVVPRIQGGKTAWENIVTSCYPCNDRKAGRTPEQAGMALRKKPFRPKTLPMTTLTLSTRRIPSQWAPYIDNSTGFFYATDHVA